MDKIDILTFQNKIDTMLPALNEYQRRRYLGAEAKALGRGGITLISNLSGASHKTIRQGIRELDAPDAQTPKLGRSRKEGGGRIPVWEEQPGILETLRDLVEPHTKGDPERLLLWTNKSFRNLANGLVLEGFRVSHVVVGKMLKLLGYSPQSNKKTLTAKPSHEDRNEQFEYINTETLSANKAGNPVLSIDAKKKENIGNFGSVDNIAI